MRELAVPTERALVARPTDSPDGFQSRPLVGGLFVGDGARLRAVLASVAPHATRTEVATATTAPARRDD
jgi:hypothetical protein